MKTLYDMPLEPPEDLAHARWRVRFFRHLVEEHRTHPYPEIRNDHWVSEDASYVDHLSRAEAALANMESQCALPQKPPPERNTLTSPSPDWHERRVS